MSNIVFAQHVLKKVAVVSGRRHLFKPYVLKEVRGSSDQAHLFKHICAKIVCKVVEVTGAAELTSSPRALKLSLSARGGEVSSA